MSLPIVMLLNPDYQEFGNNNAKLFEPISMQLNHEKQEMDKLHSGNSTLCDHKSDSESDSSYATSEKDGYFTYNNDPHVASSGSWVPSLNQDQDHYRNFSKSTLGNHGERRPVLKRKKSLHYLKCLSGVEEMSTLEFADWHAKNMKNVYIMERGLRLIHPGILSLDWMGISKFTKPKLSIHPFRLSFNPRVGRELVRSHVEKGKIAMIATFRWYVNNYSSFIKN
jgi:hypothetical protein